MSVKKPGNISFAFSVPVSSGSAERQMCMRTVLFIEDTSDQRDLVAMFLEMNGYHVEVANNGIEGLEQARRLQPDLILLDLGMPKMDGYQVMERLRTDEALKDIPIVVISAWTAAKHRERAEAAGAAAFIAKPFELTHVLTTVQKYMPPN
jgi:chemosensory pili system protein ChpA (sensor histidine kinase/response regulator)